MAPYGGIYITHMRSEADQVLEGMDEALRIGAEGGVPVEIYHLKAAGTGNWSKELAMISEIDVIWETWQSELEPQRSSLNTSVKKQWEEREIPRDADAKWSAAAKDAHTKLWEARIARQREVDASIAAKAETEYLFDKPYEDKKNVRVAGPFTVESLSPHRVLGVDENDELIDKVMERKTGYVVGRDFPSMIFENLKAAGVQQAVKADRIEFTSLTPWPGDLVGADGRYLEGGAEIARQFSLVRNSSRLRVPISCSGARSRGKRI